MPSGGIFQTILAIASEEEGPAPSLLSSGGKAHAGDSAAGRAASKQQEAQPPSVHGNEDSPVATPIPSADQETSPAEKSSGIREKDDSSNQESSAITPGDAPDRPSIVPRDASIKLAGSEWAADASAAERTASSLKHLDETTPLDPAVNGAPVASVFPGNITDSAANNAALAAAASIPALATLPMGAALPNMRFEGQSSISAAGSAASGAVSCKNPELAATTTAATGKTTDTGSGSNDASSHSASGNGQSSHNAPADSSQTAESMPKFADNGSTQIQVQTVVSQVATHETATTHRAPDGLDVGSRAAVQRESASSTQSDSGEAAATTGINVSTLTQTMSKTEMRVGMHSIEFGDISIRTSVSQQQIQAQISLDHNELSQAISAHLSAVQTKLGGDFGFPASIQITNLGTALSGEPGHSSQREQAPFTRSLPNGVDSAPAGEDSGLISGALVSAGNGYRLDIRA